MASTKNLKLVCKNPWYSPNLVRRKLMKTHERIVIQKSKRNLIFCNHGDGVYKRDQIIQADNIGSRVGEICLKPLKNPCAQKS